MFGDGKAEKFFKSPSNKVFAFVEVSSNGAVREIVNGVVKNKGIDGGISDLAAVIDGENGVDKSFFAKRAAEALGGGIVQARGEANFDKGQAAFIFWKRARVLPPGGEVEMQGVIFAGGARASIGVAVREVGFGIKGSHEKSPSKNYARNKAMKLKEKIVDFQKILKKQQKHDPPKGVTQTQSCAPSLARITHHRFCVHSSRRTIVTHLERGLKGRIMVRFLPEFFASYNAESAN